MTYPIFRPFKSRVYNASSTSSNNILTVAVAARAKLVDAFYVTTSLASQGTAGAIDITVNGTTASGLGGITVTTSTGNSSTWLTQFTSPTVATYLNAGDVLGTVGSTCVGGTVTFVVQEF